MNYSCLDSTYPFTAGNRQKHLQELVYFATYENEKRLAWIKEHAASV